ncbi:MAG TPA: D-alanyl-D-alanine carboxypeptidase [Firmicutes bacterium]|jgi:D-alanyl-D-alanine carboxypeptidase (penicillin-binding protein 5/6)|nr:D-alanyl-D-alanine carboxypeptidase [Bacillota bacterium]HBR33592.1 D-alanyl-D-alanine carboxypeptidase [Bacillota bacterium]
MKKRDFSIQQFWRWLCSGGVLLLCLFWILWSQLELPVGGKYQRVERYPPLIYLPEEGQQPPRINAGAAILVETVSGMILYAKNEHQRKAPASTTKIMTAVVTLEKGNPSDVVTISPKAARTGGSSLWLQAGEKISLSELLEGVMLRSGNDGSVALAEHIGGSEKAFANLMNGKAKEIGALNSNFTNPHGLSAPNHYTTAFDLALISRYGFCNPEFTRIVGTREEAVEWYEGAKTRQVRNTNRLLWSFAGADGVKTGTTNKAGYCLVASATRDGRRFIAVVLNSPDRWGEAARLLEYGFNRFSLKLLAKVDRPVVEVPVRQGNPAQVELYPRRDFMVVIPAGKEGEAQCRLSLDYSALIPPVRAGTTVGKLSYYYKGQEVDWVELYPRERIVRDIWWRRLMRRN